MSDVARIRTTAFDAVTIGEFSNSIRVMVLDHVWLLGDDASSVATQIEDLRVLAHILGSDIAAGLSDDRLLAIRTEATAIIRRLERRAVRDHAAGLLDAAHHGFLEVFEPDAWSLIPDMESVAIRA